MNRKMLFSLIALSILIVVSPVFASRPPMMPPAKPVEHIWVDGELYDTVVLGEIKNPNPKSLDNLYVIVYDNGTEVAGQRPITDVAPGIKGYSGGRWAVILVTVTEAGWAVHDPDDDGDFNIELGSLQALMTHADDAGLDHFDIASEPAKYFLCPLHKNK